MRPCRVMAISPRRSASRTIFGVCACSSDTVTVEFIIILRNFSSFDPQGKPNRHC